MLSVGAATSQTLSDSNGTFDSGVMLRVRLVIPDKLEMDRAEAEAGLWQTTVDIVVAAVVLVSMDKAQMALVV